MMTEETTPQNPPGDEPVTETAEFGEADAKRADEPTTEDDNTEDEDLFKTDDDPPEEAVLLAPRYAKPEVTEEVTGDSKAAEPAVAAEKKDAPAGEEPKEPATVSASPSDLPLPEHDRQAPRKPSTISGTKYGLPEGVIVPTAMQPNLLQGRLLDTLKSLPMPLINDALAEYDDAVQIKGNSIRNHGAYLYGVIKRYVEVQDRASRGEGQGKLPMGQDLTPPVNIRLQKLVDDKFCTQQEMNDKVKSKIRMLSDVDAMFAIDELQSGDRRQIRNFGSYFMGILNRYMRGDSGPGNALRKNEAYDTAQQPGRDVPRFDRNQDRFHRGNDDHGRGRDQQNREHNESYKRERSRDRDHDGDHRRRGGEPFDRRDAYRDGSPLGFDPRQQKPYYRGPQPSMTGPPPPPPRMPPGVLAYPPPAVIPPGVLAYPQLGMPLVYPPVGPQSPFVPQNMGGAPFVPPQMGGAPFAPPQMGGVPGQVPQYMGIIHAMPPQQYAAPPGAYPNGPSGNNNRQMRGNPDSYGSRVPPIMVVPPSMGQPSYAVLPSSHQPPPQRGPGPGPYPGAPRGQGVWQQPLAVDILGLADKAAYAVQALASQNHPGMPPVNMMRPPPGAYPGAPPIAYGQPPISMPHPPGAVPDPNGPKGGRRRTIATMQELPVMVQYAVQNLQATNQIDGPLDEGMLGMVKDLPEELALVALQKFSSIDKNTMRNKTAYLAGVLRRELEKINRR